MATIAKFDAMLDKFNISFIYKKIKWNSIITTNAYVEL